MLPPRQIREIRWFQLRATLLDLRLRLLGKREPGLPPHRLRTIGAGDFRRQGEELLRLLVETGGLRRDDRVLDVGCGVGRVALPLTGYLEASATYDGIDPVRPAIRWCRREISRRHPNFRFAHLDVYNSLYNRRGRPAAEATLPYPDGSFTFTFATSLFTHLDLATTRRYLDETRRLARPGGRLLATFFLLAPEDTFHDLEFPHRREGYAVQSASVPDAAVAYDRDALLGWLAASGWQVTRLTRGTWTGDAAAPCYQDVVVATAS